jgi:hypothetical protein
MLLNHWFIEHPRKPYFLVLTDDCLGKIEGGELVRVENRRDLANGVVPKGYMLPLGYVRMVENREGDDLVVVHFSKESTDEYRITDQSIRKALFETLARHTRAKGSIKTTPSVFDTIFKPLVAAGILSLLVGWGIITALELEAGNSVVGLSVVLLLAGIGSKKLLWVLTGILIGCLARGWYNLKHRVEIERVMFR